MPSITTNRHQPANHQAAPIAERDAAHIAVAACRFALTADGEIQLTPAGEFRARDGRPEQVEAWVVDDATAPALLAALAAHQDRIVIDYEHATLYTETTGQKAPAAGWFYGADVVYRPGEGLFVTPEWTDTARAHIEAGEYQYISPVLRYDTETGVIVDILMAALTNYAAIDGMQQIGRATELAAAKFATPQPDQSTTEHKAEDNTMLEQIRALLGLDETADEAQALSAITALKQQLDDATTAIAAAKAETPPDAIAALKAVQTELAELKRSLADDEIDNLVSAALGDGRLVAAQEDWARGLGKTNLAALKGYLDTAEPIAALKGNQTGGKQPQGADQVELDETALAVCRQLHINPDDYRKTLTQEVA